MLVNCPDCNQQFDVPDDEADKPFRCSFCQIDLHLPKNQTDIASAVMPSVSDPKQQGGAQLTVGTSVPIRGLLIWLYVAIGFDLLIAIVYMINLYQGAAQFGKREGQVIIGGSLFLLVIYHIPVIFIFIGTTQLQGLHNWGLVKTGCIMAFIVAGLLLVASCLLVIAIINAFQIGAFFPLFSYLNLLLYMLGMVLNLLGGVWLFMMLDHLQALAELRVETAPGSALLASASRVSPKSPTLRTFLLVGIGLIIGLILAAGIVIFVAVSKPTPNKPIWTPPGR